MAWPSEARVDEKPTLAEAGISKNLANEGRKLGALSEKEFERAVTTAREAVAILAWLGLPPLSTRSFISAGGRSGGLLGSMSVNLAAQRSRLGSSRVEAASIDEAITVWQKTNIP